MHPEDLLTVEEWHRLLEAAVTPRETAILWLLGGAGLRLNEVATLKTKEIDIRDGYLYITGKGNKQRTCVALDAIPVVQKYLDSAGIANGYVFPGRANKHISTRTIQIILDNLAKKAHLQDTRPGKVRMRKRVTPHLLRHSYAIFCIESGVPVSDLSAQLGHSDLGTTGIYLKAFPNHRKENFMKSGLGKKLGGKIHE